MRVKNVNGTSSLSCNCGSWLDHWKKYSEYNRIEEEIPCSVIGCKNKATDGGHIQKIPSDIEILTKSGKWYIVPLCKQCNQRNDEFDIYDRLSCVSANVAETCGRNRDDQLFRRPVFEARREVTAENQALRRELISRVPDDPKNTSRSRFNK